MHDPCSAAQQFNRTDFGGFCMYDCEGELTNKMQAGVHLYQLGINKSNLAALVVVKWTQDDDAMKEIFKKEIRRLQK
jgi:hypothetical protein